MTPIVVTHILDSKTAFGATKTSPSEGVFIPSKISEMFDLVAGQEVEATLVPNTMQPDRTPWLAIRVKPIPPATLRKEAKVKELVSAKVERILKSGGVWTVQDLAEELETNDRASIKKSLHSMYARGDCAKFQMLWASDNGDPSAEWFTCHPENADVAEWAEDEV